MCVRWVHGSRVHRKYVGEYEYSRVVGRRMWMLWIWVEGGGVRWGREEGRRREGTGGKRYERGVHTVVAGSGSK